MKQSGTLFAFSGFLVLAAVMLLATQESRAQLKLPRPSPNAEVTQTIGPTVIKVDYSRPGVKGREIWGKLVPFDQVWRAGANDATTITFSTDVTIGGKKLAAGSYSFFILPTTTDWTFIFNGEPKQWGSFNYNKDKDVLRLTVKPDPAPSQEWLSYNFEDIKPNSCRFVIRWEKIVAGLTIETPAPAKDARVSPAATVQQTLGVTDILVNYSRPGVKGREVWGKLVPFGEVWRAGANEATRVTFADDVLVGGKKLAAGTYGFFVLPTADTWTFIFNSVSKQWGAFTYAKDKDVLQIAAKPEDSPNQEWLEYSVNPVQPNAGTLGFAWDKKRASVSIEVDTTPGFIWGKVKAQVSSSMDDQAILNQGARYGLTSKQHLDEAMVWAQKSVSIKKMYANLRTVAELYASLGKTDDAVKTGEEAIKIGKEQDPKLNSTAFEKMIMDWKSKK